MLNIAGTLSKAWLARQLHVVFDHDYYFDPVRRHEVDSACHHYARQALGDLDIFYTESNLGRARFHSDRQVLIGGIQPNMILGMLVEADFLPRPDMDADISPQPLAGVDVADLPTPTALLEHPLISTFDQQIQHVRADGKLRPIPPFFWDNSGRAAIHGVLTTAQKLWGEQTLMDLITNPAQTHARLSWVAQAYLALVLHFAAIVDRTTTELHLGECSGCMVGPDLFEKLIVEHTSSLGQTLAPVRFHTCGPSTRLLEPISKIVPLHSVDLGAETSIAQARKVLGPNLPIDIAPLPQHLSAETPEPLLDWARSVVRDNHKGPLTFVYHLEPDYHLPTVRALHQFIKQQADE